MFGPQTTPWLLADLVKGRKDLWLVFKTTAQINSFCVTMKCFHMFLCWFYCECVCVCVTVFAQRSKIISCSVPPVPNRLIRFRWSGLKKGFDYHVAFMSHGNDPKYHFLTPTTTPLKLINFRGKCHIIPDVVVKFQFLNRLMCIYSLKVPNVLRSDDLGNVASRILKQWTKEKQSILLIFLILPYKIILSI